MNFTQRTQPDFSWFNDFDRFFGRSRSISNESIFETPDAYVIRLDLPGFDKPEVALKVTDRQLRLTAEATEKRSFAGKVDRQWKLGAKADPSAITANLENGILEISIPKAEPVTPETIDININ